MHRSVLCVYVRTLCQIFEVHLDRFTSRRCNRISRRECARFFFCCCCYPNRKTCPFRLLNFETTVTANFLPGLASFRAHTLWLMSLVVCAERACHVTENLRNATVVECAPSPLLFARYALTLSIRNISSAEKY